MNPSTPSDAPYNRKDSLKRKGTPAAMGQPEPLKVFLQHRIRSIISKEWWDFVVNVNNMNSDHASLLYSVANLCPSFQNFLRTRDKELNYILQKRPTVKPRIFSGAEKLPTEVATKSVFSTQKTSCSAELDQLLSDLYPKEVSIIKRKPRTFGPISKQRRMQSMKKYEASKEAARKEAAKKEATVEDPNSITLSMLLREDNPCTTGTEMTNPSSIKNSKDEVEYTISNYDVNRNKLSLNMKKVKKKMIKVKKKILTYTDNNDKSRTKYLLESETPDLKREQIKKYRIKKCSVVLQRLSRKQIKDMRAKTKSTNLLNLLANSKSNKSNKVSSSSKVDKTHPTNSKVDKTHPTNSKVDKTHPTNSKVDKTHPTNSSTDTNRTIYLKELISKGISVEVASKDKTVCNDPAPISTSEETSTSLPTPQSRTSNEALKKLLNSNKKDTTTSNDTKSEAEPKKTSETVKNVESSITNCDNTLNSANNQEISKNEAHVNNEQTIPTKIDVIILKEKLSNKLTSKSNQDKTETFTVGIKLETIIEQTIKEFNLANERSSINSTCDQSGNSSDQSDSLIEKESLTSNKSNLSENTADKAEDKCDEPPNKIIKLERSRSPSNEVENTSSAEAETNCKSPSNQPEKIGESFHNQTNQKSADKAITDNVTVSPKSPEKESPDSPNVSLTPKYRINQKENFALGEKYNPKEFVKELKDLYCHGGIVPLGKKSASVIEKSSFDKNKHFLSLKEKKIKETPPDTSDSVSPLKEKNIQSLTTESKQEITPLNGLKNVDKVIETVKPADIASVIESSTNIKSEAINDKVKNSFNVNLNAEDKESTTNINPAEGSIPITTQESCDKEDSLNTQEDVDTSKDDSGSEKDLIIDETVAKEVEVTTSTPIEVNNEDNSCTDDVILIETPTEVIEIDSQDEDEPCTTVTKIKVEKIVYDSSTDPKIVSDTNSSNIEKDFVVLNADNGEDSSSGIEEPEHKRPRLEINLTKMEIDNTNCKLCDTIFSSHGEWLKHFVNDVPKCAPNLKVSWDQSELSLIN